MKQERCPPHPRRAQPFSPAWHCPVGPICQRQPLPPIKGAANEEGSQSRLPQGLRASTWHLGTLSPATSASGGVPAPSLCPQRQPSSDILLGAAPWSIVCPAPTRFLLRAVFFLFLKNIIIIFFNGKNVGCCSEVGLGPRRHLPLMKACSLMSPHSGSREVRLSS